MGAPGDPSGAPQEIPGNPQDIPGNPLGAPNICILIAPEPPLRFPGFIAHPWPVKVPRARRLGVQKLKYRGSPRAWLILKMHNLLWNSNKDWGASRRPGPFLYNPLLTKQKRNRQKAVKRNRQKAFTNRKQWKGMAQEHLAIFPRS